MFCYVSDFPPFSSCVPIWNFFYSALFLALNHCCYDFSEQLEAFFKYILKLEYTEKPDYNRIKQWFKDGLKKNGAADDGKSVIFTSPAPKKKGKAATNDEQLVNGDKKRVCFLN